MKGSTGRTKFGVRQPTSHRKKGLVDPQLVGDADPTRPCYPNNPPADRDAARLAEQKKRTAERKARKRRT